MRSPVRLAAVVLVALSALVAVSLAAVSISSPAPVSSVADSRTRPSISDLRQGAWSLFAPTGTPLPPTATATPPPSRTPPPTATATLVAEGPVLAPAPYLTFRRPFDAPADDRPSRYYPYGTTGNDQYLLHHGVDIGNPLGTPVLAVGAGTVVYAGSDAEVPWGPEHDFYGNLVVLAHENVAGAPIYSLYGHVARPLVQIGQVVRAGEPVAEVGAEGIALGPHLHLEFRTSPRDYESTLNPELLLVPSPGTGVIAGSVRQSDGSPAPGATVGLYAAGAGEAIQWFTSTRSYPADHVNSSPVWRENLVFGDVPEGTYRLRAADGSLGDEIVVRAGEVTRTTIAGTP